MRNSLGTLFLILLSTLSLAQEEGKWQKTNQPSCKYLDFMEKDDVHHAVWEGSCEDGKIHGTGKLYVYQKPKGSPPYVRYTFTGTAEHGHLRDGEIVFSSDYYLKGHFVDGKLQGKGSWSLGSTKYEGDFLNGSFDGKGVLIDSEKKYEGNFDGGSYSGYGVLTKTDGTVYTGNFSFLDLNGEGTITFPNGDILTGNFTSGGTPDKNCQYIYTNGEKFTGTYQNLVPWEGEIYKNGIHVANLSEGKKIAKKRPIPENGMMIGEDLYVGPSNINGPHGTGVLYFQNRDTLYATFNNGEAARNVLYIYKNGYRFIGSTRNNKPYDGKVYDRGIFLYEIKSGEAQVPSETADSYPEGQYNPWNTYVKPGSKNQTESKSTPDPVESGFRKGVATYKGVGDNGLVIEIQAEVLYKSRKDEGLLGLKYFEISEAKGVRFRYPGNSATWYNFGDSDLLYTCTDKSVNYTCASIKGMVFVLTEPEIR